MNVDSKLNYGKRWRLACLCSGFLSLPLVPCAVINVVWRRLWPTISTSTNDLSTLLFSFIINSLWLITTVHNGLRRVRKLRHNCLTFWGVEFATNKRHHVGPTYCYRSVNHNFHTKSIKVLIPKGWTTSTLLESRTAPPCWTSVPNDGANDIAMYKKYYYDKSFINR